MPIMTIDLVTLFPQMVEGFLTQSVIGRATKKNILSIKLHDLREWALPPHYAVDDRPFGGGAGMLLQPEPLFKAIETLGTPQSKVVYLCPDGVPLTSNLAKELSEEKHLILISGHYEGIDERVRESIVDLEISIGDYILTNGTLAAAVLIDAVSRFIPDVLGEEKSLTQDSFNDNLLTFPQYTRPANFRGMQVPEILLSGNHQAIEEWRRTQQIQRTKERRPDLIKKFQNKENHASNN
ncbi:MAG: tRNA (guanosine(37)-N1)-methyltransferase TrmD [Verrucomicrobia bacterium]|nr:MAG: tRNA (guanosine(37)-N1)-methyltransferase TrmD [Verrucomicrobiota bacterium]